MEFTEKELKNLFQLYGDSHAQLVSIGLSLHWPRHEILDVVNQLFLDLAEKKVDWSDVQEPRAYVVRAFRNRLTDLARRKKREHDHHHVLADQADQSELSAEEILLRREDQEQLLKRMRQAYADLPPRCRQVIRLKYYEGLTTAQIADRLGLTERSIYNNLFEGIRQLRTTLHTGGQPSVSSALFALMLFQGPALKILLSNSW